MKTDLLKKRNAEFFVHLILLLIILVNGTGANIKVSYYGFLLPLYALFLINSFVLVPTFFIEKQYLRYTLYLLFTFAGCFAISVVCSSIGQSIYSNNETSTLEALTNFPSIRRESLLSLTVVLIFSGIYAFIRQLVIAHRYQLLKRIALICSMSIVGVAAIVGIKYYVDVSWKGSDSIHFMDDQTYQSLEEVIRQPQFKNKVVYVDLWFTSCKPCILEFQQLPEVKASLKGKPVEYLYLAQETSLPNDKQRWKNMTQKFDLNGWHLYMTPQFAKNIWEIIGENTNIRNRYPHFLLIDQQGKVVSYNAHRPQSKMELIGEIEQLLN